VARNEKRRAKALARKKRKKQRRQGDGSSGGPFGAGSNKALIRRGREFPIRECLVAQYENAEGLHQLLITRDVPDGRMMFACYLVDASCLGVKDAFCNVAMRGEYERDLRDKIGRLGVLEPVSVEYFHQLLYGAIEYARQFGFEPHRDFGLASNVAEPSDRFEPNPDIEFGLAGRPLYVSGPHDNVQRILAALDRNPGPGNYDFLVGGPHLSD
jgi:hypothetical protein